MFPGWHSPATCLFLLCLFINFIRILHACVSLSLHLNKSPHVVHLSLHHAAIQEICTGEETCIILFFRDAIYIYSGEDAEPSVLCTEDVLL